jgi:homoserine O-acetyltransferase
MDVKFGRKFQNTDSKVSGNVDYEVENYLQYKGEKFSDSFDANSYILMTKAMDGYDALQILMEILKRQCLLLNVVY